MKNKFKAVVALPVLALGLGLSLTSCSEDLTNVIRVAASSSPHAEILEDAVAPLLEAKGYTLRVEEYDWTLQNEAVEKGEYEANYFQHRPYLQEYDAGESYTEYSESYAYTKVFPVVGVHFEPLRFYHGTASVEEFESIKTLSTTTFAICNDATNAERACDLLVENGILDADYDVDNLPSNIVKISEETLASLYTDYSYGLLPCNTALTAGIEADPGLPVESNDVKEYRANVLAASVTRYAEDAAYKTKIDLLADALLDESVATYIEETYNGVIVTVQDDYR